MLLSTFVNNVQIFFRAASIIIDLAVKKKIVLIVSAIYVC